ncbi:MAG: hypothetical protein IJ244_08405 [Bacteroidaceae bacterium]|nr:hypothetical protein [Bacteroidaceae bacterium]
MKKKIINGLLTVALIFAASSAFVSCKDYEGDDYNRLQGQIDDLIAGKIADFESRIKALENARTKVEARVDSIAGVLGTFAKIANVYDKAAADGKFQPKGDYVTAGDLADFLKADTLSEYAKTADIPDVSGFLTLSDLDPYLTADKLATELAKSEALKTLINNVISQYSFGGDTTIINNYVTNLTYDDSLIVARITAVEKTLSIVQGVAQAASELAKDDSIRIDELKNFADSLAGVVSVLPDKVETALTDAANAQAKADANEIQINKLDSIFGVVKSQLEDADSQLAKRIDSLAGVTTALADSIEKVKELAEENLQKAKDYADEAAKKVQDNLDVTNTNLEKLQDAFAEAVEEINDKLDELADDIDDLDKRITANTIAIAKLAGLTERVEKVEDAVNKLITNILIQGTTNPVLGYTALPFNVRSNILVALYGEALGEFEFPTARPAYYVDQDDVVLTDDDINFLNPTTIEKSKGQKLLGEEENNAGTLYLTVNSYDNSADFTGAEFALENSIGEASGIKLGALKKSEQKLTFGWVKAAANNNFYEAPAQLTEDALDALTKLDVNDFQEDAAALKNVAKDLIRNRENVSVGEIANTFIDAFNKVNTKLDANAVKAPWTDANGDHAIYSQYELAATAYHPLSYAFAKDLNYSSIPGFDRLKSVESLVSDLIDNINIAISLGLDNVTPIDVTKIKGIGEITISDANKALFNIVINENYAINVPGFSYDLDNDGTPDIEWSGYDNTITVAVDKNMAPAIDDLLNSINDQLGNVNTTIETLKTLATQVNGVLEQLNSVDANITASINQAKADIQKNLKPYFDKYNNFIERIEGTALKVINNANRALQPVLLVSTENGYARLGQTKNTPLVVDATTVELVPTSYTLEILAPAYKKFIAATKAYKADGTEDASAAQALNTGDLNKVIPGQTSVVEVSGLQSGYTYEIVYSAVDYSGKVVAKKFYIKAA